MQLEFEVLKLYDFTISNLELMMTEVFFPFFPLCISMTMVLENG